MNLAHPSQTADSRRRLLAGRRPTATGGPGIAPRPARLKPVLKALVNGVGFIVAALPAATCLLEKWVSRREDVFLFWGQVFALIPGLPGRYLRRCFYYLTLEQCALDCEIGFLACFVHRRARVGPRVFVGPAANLGAVTLGAGALIGSRASILNGGRQHEFLPDGRLSPCDSRALPQVTIGAETWIGEASIVLADVGSQSIVAAGSVVAKSVPDRCIVGGNPARFVGKVSFGLEEPEP
jgi:acetyltransferase-like isoleucine patch superfamily enzyme